MATEIITNINSVLVQKGIRVSANFVQSTVFPAFFQFSVASPGDLNVGDTIFVLYSVSDYIEAEITDITGSNVTINTLIFILYPSTFTRFIVLPPDTGSVDLDVNVVAAFNPVVIEMQRIDFTFNLFRSTWDPAVYAFDAGDDINNFIQGSYINILTFGPFNNYNQRKKISFISGTIVNINLNYVPSFPTPLISFNLESRLNFYVTLRITRFNFNSDYRELRFTPNSSGFIRAEISGALRSLLNLNFTEPISETDILTDETNLSSGFFFSTLENWIGSNEFLNSYNEDVKFCIAGAFQIGDPNNGYYNKYFGNTEGTKVYPELMPQWVTQFENPVYFFGFPFTLSFLGNSQMVSYAGYFVRCKFTQADGTVDTLLTSAFVFTAFISLARLNIAEILNDPLFLPYTQNSKKIEIRFGRGESGLFLDAFAPITINVKRSIEQSCNTFFVKWLNTLGGWDYWLFEGKIYEGYKVENGNNYESYFDNISDTKDFENVTFKNVSPAVQVGSNTLTRNEAEGLKVLPTSPKIYWYNEELSKWIGVRVEPGTFNLRSTKEDYFNIELTFVKPKYFNQYA